MKSFKFICNSRYISIDKDKSINYNTMIYNISFIVSKKHFLYKIIIHNKDDGISILDVLPLKITTLNEIDGYNYYNFNTINDIMNICNNNSNNDDDVRKKLLIIGEILIKSIINKDVVHYNLGKWKDNVKLSFMLSFFCDIDDVSILTFNSNSNSNSNDRIDSTNNTIVIEVPLISNTQKNESIEYLMDIVKDNPILLTITIQLHSSSKEISVIKTDVMIPSKTFKCTSNLELSSSFKDYKVHDFKIEDVSTYYEKKIVKQWLYRKRLTEELMKNSAVLEYDAIDFSYILLGIRLKRNNAFASCTVSFTFKEAMVMAVPKIVVHDILRSFEKELDTSSILVVEQSPQNMANELLSFITRSICKQAFDT